MPWSFTPFQIASAIFGFALDIVFVTFVLKRNLHRNLICFFIYVMILVPRGFIWFYIAHTPLFRTLPAFYFYWLTELILSLLRLATITEICLRALRPYPAIRGFAWRLLSAVGLLLLLWTAHFTLQNLPKPRYYVTAGMQGLELTQAALLLTLLAFGIYYQIHLPPLYRWVLIGICFYSAVQVGNYALGRITLQPSYSLFNYIEVYSFTVSEFVWTWALWRSSPARIELPATAPQAVYDQFSPVIHDRLRTMNDRLARFVAGETADTRTPAQ